MKMSALLLTAACAAPVLCAQQAAAPIVSLKAVSVGQTPLEREVFDNPNDDAMCDGAGNVYFPREEKGEKLGRLPIQEIASEGKWGAVFRAPDAIVGLVRGVFVDNDGRVYRLVSGAKGVPRKYSDKGYYLLEFAPDGSVKAETKLQLEPGLVDPWHLAVFKSGEFLVVGATRENHSAPFTAVFAADGKLVKRIYEPEDEEARQKGLMEWGQGPVIDARDNFAVSSSVAAGSDGNVYLLRGGYPSMVYVISPSGDVIRKVRVDAGDPNLRAYGMKFYDGRLAIGFEQLVGADALIKVIDLKGNVIANYGVGAGFEASRLACYGPEGFTMLPRVFETKSYLLKAKLP